MTSVNRLQPKSRRWGKDSAYNYAALAATAVAGTAINVMIAKYHGAGALGVFAQLYALYAVTSQVAMLGVGDSIQKHIAEHVENIVQRRGIFYSSLALVASSAAVVATIVFVCRNVVGTILDSDDVAMGLLYVAPAIFLFCLNKTFFALLNGLGRLRAYGVVQVVRAIIMTLAMILIVWVGLPAHADGAVFLIAEALLFPILVVLTWSDWWGKALAETVKEWLGRNLVFGLRALPNAALMEVQLRVDVVMVSVFLSDEDVGIYSFAALFAEGLYQLAVVIRTVAYPTLVHMHAGGGLQVSSSTLRLQAARLVRKLSLVNVLLTTVVGLAIVLIYPTLASVVAPVFIERGYTVLQILLAGICLYSVFAPFDQILLQSGRAGIQSIAMILAVVVNVALNARLISQIGLPGAALATLGSLMAMGFAVSFGTWHWLGYRGTILLHVEKWHSD